ncbi:hypothetical protein K438DRAFT_2127393 [Mycena galopus ATCC 62051]|nr:hypothetical protein K438DRAFT_2127393 [Mycena galopus ATCC 62051]
MYGDVCAFGHDSGADGREWRASLLTLPARGGETIHFEPDGHEQPDENKAENDAEAEVKNERGNEAAGGDLVDISGCVALLETSNGGVESGTGREETGHVENSGIKDDVICHVTAPPLPSKMPPRNGAKRNAAAPSPAPPTSQEKITHNTSGEVYPYKWNQKHGNMCITRFATAPSLPTLPRPNANAGRQGACIGSGKQEARDRR